MNRAKLSLLCIALLSQSLFTTVSAQSPPQSISIPADQKHMQWGIWAGTGMSDLNAHKYAEAASNFSVAAVEAAKFDPSDPCLLMTLSELSDAYTALGDYSQAETTLKKAMQISENTAGLDNASYMVPILNRLGTLSAKMGKSEEARAFNKRASLMSEKRLEEGDPASLTALLNRATNCDLENKNEEAEALYKQVLSLQEKSPVSYQKEDGVCLSNLAGLYDKEGRYAEAEPLYKRALDITEKTCGPDDPQVANRFNNIGLLYHHEGKYAEAEGAYKRSIQIREKTQGPNHPDLVPCLGNLSQLYKSQGKSAEAAFLDNRIATIQANAALSR